MNEEPMYYLTFASEEDAAHVLALFAADGNPFNNHNDVVFIDADGEVNTPAIGTFHEYELQRVEDYLWSLDDMGDIEWDVWAE